MGIINDLLRTLGVVGSKKSRNIGVGLPALPNPGEIKEAAEAIAESLSNLKELPKTLIDRVVEADQDFRGADKALRSTRVHGKRK